MGRPMKHYEMRKYPHERMEQFDARISMKGNKRVKRNLKEWFKHKHICALKHKNLCLKKER